MPLVRCFALSLLGLVLLHPQRVSAGNLDLTISLDRTEYLTYEPIIVDFELTNSGEETIETREPLVAGLSLDFVFRGPRATSAPRRTKFATSDAEGTEVWRPGVIELEPGESYAGSTELFHGMKDFDGDFYLRSGQYALHAEYHPLDHEDLEQRIDAVVSNSIEFTIAAPKDNEKSVSGMLGKHRRINRQYPNDTDRRRKLLEDVLKKHPETVYRVRILDKLATVEHDAADWEAAVRVSASLRAEKNISRTKRDTLAATEAGLLHRKLGRLADAIRVLEDATLHPVIEYRKHLIEQWRRENPGLPLAVLSADAADSESPQTAEAAALYAHAEKLRREKKFDEARRIHRRVVDDFADTSLAPAADFRAGQCLVGSGRFDEAADHWRRFLRELPNGPWRGQTHRELIDIALEREADIEAAAGHAEIAQEVLEQGAPKEAAASWKAVACELHFRSGLIAAARNHRADAVRFFAQAKRTSVPRIGVSRSAEVSPPDPLDSLIVLLKTNRDLLPEELRGKRSDEKTKTILRLGSVCNRLGRYDAARRIFANFECGSIHASTAAEKAFVITGAAVALHESGKLDEAGEAYRKALTTLRDASWHDETLYRLAGLIHQSAVEAAPPSSTPDRSGAPAWRFSPGDKAKPIISGARSEAKPYWHELLDRYDDSPYREIARHQIGLADVDEENWSRVIEGFGEQVERFPDGPRTGDALVWLIDVELQSNFDIPAAAARLQTALEWTNAQLDGERPDVDERSPHGYLPESQYFPSPEPDATAYEVHLRAGLLALLRQDSQSATACFKRAETHQPKWPYKIINGGVPNGIDRLLSIAESGGSFEKLTPKTVLDGNPKAALILLLADTYKATYHPDSRFEICDRLLNDTDFEPDTNQQSYAHFRRGRSHYARTDDKRDPDAARKDYLTARRIAPKAEWSDNCLFLAANIHWNHGDKSSDRAKLESADNAILLWADLLEAYPDSDEADRAAYFIGVAYEWSGRYEKAERAFKNSKDIPKTRFAKLANRHLRELAAKRRPPSPPRIPDPEERVANPEPVRMFCCLSVSTAMRKLLGAYLDVNSPSPFRLVDSGMNKTVLKKLDDPKFDAFIYIGDPSLPEDSEFRKVSLAQFAAVIVIDPDAGVSSLSTDQLADLLTGKVRNWSELGGSNLPVSVVGGGAVSHAAYLIRATTGMTGRFRADQIVERQGPRVIGKVKRTPGAIGYYLHDWYEVDEDLVRVVAISQHVEKGGNERKAPTAHAPTKANVALGRYPLAYPLTMLTRPRPDSKVRKFERFATGLTAGNILRRYNTLPEYDRKRFESD